MDPQDAVDMGREGLMVCLTVGGPILAFGLLVGILVGVIQAMTHVQDQTVSFVPKILAIALALAICLPWLAGNMVEYSKQMFEKPRLVSTDWNTE